MKILFVYIPNYFHHLEDQSSMFSPPHTTHTGYAGRKVSGSSVSSVSSLSSLGRIKQIHQRPVVCIIQY